MLEPNNEFEENALKEFKIITQDLNQDEPTLIRFLKARSYQLDKAEKMIRDCMVWREENKIDEIMEWDVPELIRVQFPYSISGVDHDGGPIMWIPFGLWSKTVREFVEQGGRDEMLRWAYYFIETGLNYIKNNRNGRNQSTVVFDIGGLNYYTALSIPCLKTVFTGFKVFEACYPEICKRVIFINAPWIFNGPFNYIKSVMHANTVAKIKIFGSNKKVWLAHLLEIFPRKSISDKYFEDENGNQ